MFHCPGDAFMGIYNQPILSYVWDIIRGVAIAYSISQGAIEKLMEAPWGGNKVDLHTYILLGIVASSGGQLIAEYGNLLLFRVDQYKTAKYGPSSAFLVGLFNTLVYIFIIRDPVHFWRQSWIPFYAPFPLTNDKYTAIAYLSLFTIFFQSRHLLSPAVINEQVSKAMNNYIPGWKSSFVPTQLSGNISERLLGVGNDQSVNGRAPNNVFGYPKLIDLDDDEDTWITEEELLKILQEDEGLEVDDSHLMADYDDFEEEMEEEEYDEEPTPPKSEKKKSTKSATPKKSATPAKKRK
jgi:hypothetical protein